MDRRRPSPLLVGFGALALVVGCGGAGSQGSGSGGSPGSGGSGEASGGTTGSGGSATGGTTGSGGAPSTGGATGSGGASSTGGATGSGGASPTGGTTGTGGGGTGGAAGAKGGAGGGGAAGSAGAKGTGGAGGAKGSGGATGSGGASSTGGATGSGGAAGAGGGATGQQPFKGFAGDPTACADMQHLSVSWYYNWKQTPSTGCSSTGIPFVPMIWGHTGSEQSASGITSAVSSFVSKGYGYVLGFNEPDNSTQSNIVVATAVSLWPSFDNSAIVLGTPATQANSTGQAWFTSFMGSVNGSSTLHADFIALHWYGWNSGSCDAKASQLESYIKYAEAFSGSRPIWLTEWGCLNQSAPDTTTVLNFYNGALAVFARHPRVQRYSWYPWSTNNELVNSDGSLTTLGMAYAAAPAYK
jgi:Glycosyl hydrolase catalytic core